jgi:transposase
MVSEGGHSLAQVARDLDIRPDMIRRWRRQLQEDPEQAFPGVGQRKARDEEVWQLRRELERVTQERDILKKALGIVSDRRR